MQVAPKEEQDLGWALVGLAVFAIVLVIGSAVILSCNLGKGSSPAHARLAARVEVPEESNASNISWDVLAHVG